MSEELMRTSEVADLLRSSPATLRYWRHIGVGPKSFRLGGKRVFYKRSDVEAWLEEQYAGTKGA